MNEFVKIEYSNSVDMAGVVYHNTFMNRLYLDADVSKPQYVIDEDGIEDADGEFDPTFQKWAKKYSITFYAQEFLVDALTLMTLHDQIYVTLKNEESSQVLDVEIEYTWDSDIECWAEVVLTFTTDYIVKRKCDGNMQQGCEEPVCVADDAYDADGAGATRWAGDGSTAGEISFFYTALEGGDSVYTGSPLGFYQRSSSGWTLIDIGDGNFGEVTGLGGLGYVSKSGDYYYKIPFIRAVVDDGSDDATISCYARGIESNFYQAQYNSGGWADLGDPQLASAFDEGFQVTPGAGVDIEFRILWYTHGCEYGYSNVVTQTIT